MDKVQIRARIRELTLEMRKGILPDEKRKEYIELVRSLETVIEDEKLIKNPWEVNGYR